MKHKKLVIISHTEHYINDEQKVVGWGSTINEVNYLADFWEEIVHVGCLYNTTAPKSSLPYTKNNIHFAPIPPYGGKTSIEKIKILFKIPKIIYQVIKNIKNATEVQLRLPTSMGVFLLPLFSFFLSRKYVFWVKYAGNWSQVNPPLSYRIQKWWLKNNLTKCKVTINGFWDNQPKHCLSFENPCLTDEDIIKGSEIIDDKNFTDKFTLCFVGRLDESKGVDVILASLNKIDLNKIEKVHFIGDGVKRHYFEKEATFLYDKAIFHGFLEKTQVHQILEKSHFLLLPSKSEGFPKVIAEAACYGVIPIVSNVGSIGHYVNESNGFLWDRNSEIPFDKIMNAAFQNEVRLLENKSQNLTILAEKFTFTNYISKLEKEILH
jgi:glycosyltransferase involved in cell wall biosynthesis